MNVYGGAKLEVTLKLPVLVATVPPFGSKFFNDMHVLLVN